MATKITIRRNNKKKGILAEAFNASDGELCMNFGAPICTRRKNGTLVIELKGIHDLHYLKLGLGNIE